MIRYEKSDRPDEELVRLAAGGDAAAFEEIHRRCRNLVYTLALRITGNAANAEDVKQDSFISILQRIGCFRGDASFGTWLYCLTANQVKTHFRRCGSRPEGPTCDGELSEREPGVSFHRDSHHVIERLAIEKALRRLQLTDRAAFFRHDFDPLADSTTTLIDRIKIILKLDVAQTH
jgi:RNA polymerase sigma factor (sigma-70 family)